MAAADGPGELCSACVRWPFLIVIALAVPAIALARPKVAVAPLDGDDDGKLAAVVAEEAKEHAKVTSAKQVGKTMSSLGLDDASSARALKKLRNKLEVDAVIHGKVEREGSKKRLELTVSGRHNKESTFELKFKSATAKTFKKELRDKLAKHIESAGEGDAAEDDADDDVKVKPTFSDDDSKTKHADDEASHDKPEKAEKPEKVEKPKRIAAEDDGSPSAHKRSDESTHRRHHHDAEEPAARQPMTQPAVWLDGGALGARRTLTYDATGMAAPPSVGTAAIAGAIAGELYPGAFSSPGGVAAGFGIYGTFGKAVGLSIPIPGSAASAAIDSGYYSIGARYRFTFGTSSLAIGASYWTQHYIADRSGPAVLLDMPDTSYTAVAPGAIARFAATPTVGVRIAAEVPLVLDSGQITSKGGYGVAQVLAFCLEGGVDIALGPSYGVSLAAVFDQIGLSFKVPQRGVSQATDRTMGATAGLAIFY